MKQILLILLIATGICPVQAQDDRKPNSITYRGAPQRDVDKKELLPLLRSGIEVMASKECDKDRKKILEFKNEEDAIAFIRPSAMFGTYSKFGLRDGIWESLPKIKKAAGFQPLDIHNANNLLAKIVVSSVRLTDETIMLMVDKARRDDKKFSPYLYISEPAELDNYPLFKLNRELLIPILRRGIEIMAEKDHEKDREKILEFDDEVDALNYVMYSSDFFFNKTRGELVKRIQEIENFNPFTGDIVADILLSNVVLNSVRLQESTMMLITYNERLYDKTIRSFIMSDSPPPSDPMASNQENKFKDSK